MTTIAELLSRIAPRRQSRPGGLATPAAPGEPLAPHESGMPDAPLAALAPSPSRDLGQELKRVGRPPGPGPRGAPDSHQPNAATMRVDLGPLGRMDPQGADPAQSKVGALLLDRGLVTASQIQAALEAQAASGHLIGRILLDHGAVTHDQLAAVLHDQSGGEKPSTAVILARLGVPAHHIRAIQERMNQTREPLPRIMRDWGFLSEEGVAKAIAIESGLEYFPRTEIDNIAMASLRMHDIGVAEYRGYVPIAYREGKRGTVAILIQDRTFMNAASSEYRQFACVFMIASGSTIQTIYRKLFARTAQTVSDLLADYNQAIANKDDLARSPLCQDLVMALLRHACYAGASDIQLFPSHDVGNIKLKLDGRWELFKVVPLDLLRRLFSVMRNSMFKGVSDEKLNQGFTDCALDIQSDKDEHAQALRARFTDIIDRYVFRVEVGNSIQGITLTIRINDRQSTAADMHQLGLDTKTLAKLASYVRSKAGVFLLAGPTGSGKTTTLYGMLRSIDALTTGIQTVERPVEYTNGLWLQYPISAMGEDEGAAWGDALKGILRNAPDAILFGEVRDQGTARECFRAALTGHLVVSTLHANGAAETVARLADLGIDADKLANHLLGVLAQRLVRKLCAACKVADERTETRQLLAPHAQQSLALRNLRAITPFRARIGGCPECGHTGFRGRRIVYELLHCSRAVKDMLETGAKLSRLREQGLDGGSMLDTGLRLVAESITSIDELSDHIDLDR